MTCRASGLVLGVYPSARGFGWAAFENPLVPFDWGLVHVGRGDKNAACLLRLEGLFDRLQPEVVVIEAFDQRRTRRANRIAHLSRSMLAAAAMRNIQVRVLTLADIRAAFAEVGATTRRQVAEAVARHCEPFRHRLPPPRRPWQSEDWRNALFAAAALALVHLRDPESA